jgi:hypothetical protein
MGHAYGYGYGADCRRGGAMPLDAATEAYVAAIIAAGGAEPDAAHKSHYNNLVGTLKSAGLWAKLELVYLLANADAIAARTNLKSPGTDALGLAGEPVFTVDRGYKGDAANYLTGPALTVLSLFTLNEASMAARSREALTPPPGATFDVETTSGTNSSFRGSNASGIIVCRANASAAIGSAAVPNTIGLYGWSRTGAASSFEHRNGVVLSTSTGAPTGIGTGTLQIGREGRQLASVHIGGGLTESEMAALTAADLAYAQAVGAA